MPHDENTVEFSNYKGRKNLAAVILLTQNAFHHILLLA